MSNRAALVSQGDITRAIRAMKNAGLVIVRVVVRPDGYAIETTDAPPLSRPPWDEPLEPPEDEDFIV